MDQTMVLFYFSGTGNTWWCAKEFATMATDQGFQVRCISIEQLLPGDAQDLVTSHRVVGVAYPIYGSDVPLPMQDFIKSLPQSSKQEALVFCTQYLWSGDGAAVAADMLEAKGYTVRWTQHILMPNNIGLPVYPKVSFTNDPQKIQRTLGRAKKKLRQLANRISSGKPWQHGRSLWARWLGLLQRAPYRKMMPKLQKTLAIDGARCTGCGLCARLCPVQCITPTNGVYVIGSGCSLCLRCYNFCPTLAVTAQGRFHETKRGMPYRGPTEDFHPNILRPRT